MTVIAFVTAAAVARAILERLRLPATAPPQAPARGPPQEQFTGWDQGAALN